MSWEAWSASYAKTAAYHMTHPKRQRNRPPRVAVSPLKGELPCRKIKKKNSASANARTKSGSTKGNSTTPRSSIGSAQSVKLKRKTERTTSQETNELAAGIPRVVCASAAVAQRLELVALPD